MITKITMAPQFHTLNEGIPKGNHGPGSIGMDTRTQREGLHLWVRGHNGLSVSVHLTRDDARALVEEINHRLF